MKSRESTLLVMLVVITVRTFGDTEAWAVREDGIGPAKAGMTLSQLNIVLHERFAMPKEKRDQGCFYVHPAGHSHVAIMIEDGRFARVDVDAPGVFTTEGIQVGDSEARTRQVYGSRLKVEPQEYPEEGHHLTARSSDGRFGIRFETEKGKVQMFYAGRFAAVQYVEGCL